MFTEPPKLPSFTDSADVAHTATLLFQYMESQITFADSKAELALLADAFLAYTVVTMTRGMELNIFDASMSPYARFTAFVTLCMIFSLLLSIVFALLAARPRITRIKQQAQKPLFYFGYINELSEDEFIARFSSQSPEEIHKAILSQVYAKAHIAGAKFKRMRTSLNFLIAAAVCWTMVLLLLGFKV